MRSALLFALAAALGCGSPAAGTAPVFEIPGGGEAPAWGEAPFPSDVWRGADGRIEAPAGLDVVFRRRAESIAAHLSILDGFGIRPLIEFPVDGEIDPDSVSGRARVFAPDGAEVPYEWRYIAERQVIAGAPVPGVVLGGGLTYTAVLERGILDVEGRRVQRAAALEALVRGDVPARWASTAAALDHPEAEEWLAIAVFTTQDAQRPIRAARAALEGGDIPAPELAFPAPEQIFAGADALDSLLGVATRFDDGPRAGQERWGMSNPTGIAHDSVGVIATGTMAAARFRRVDSGTDGVEDETFSIDAASGAPALESIDTLPITFVLPEAPPPAEGYPVVIFGHGLGSSRHAVLSFAEPLTAAGFAIVAIDADGHGSRWKDQDVRNNLAAMLPSFSGDAELVDGFGDRTGLISTFEFLEDLRNFSGARDAVRQSVLDLCQAIALIRQPDLDLGPLATAGAAPRLDGSRIAYLGESFGTILGGILAAIEPDVDLYVLDVPAAGLIDLSIVNSPALGTLILPLASLEYGIHGTVDRFHPAVSLVQAMIDAADPLTYAPNVLRDRLAVGDRTPGPRHVVAIEVIGDEVLHNLASESLAVALGLEVLRPHLAAAEGLASVESPAAANIDGQTAVLVQYAPATHGANWTSEVGTLEFVPGFPHPGLDPFPRLTEPVEITNPIYATLEQVVTILTSNAGGEAPRVESTLAPVMN